MSVTLLPAEPTDMVVQPASSYAEAARVRSRIVLLAADERAPGRVVITIRKIEIEGQTKPALIAESLSMLVTAPPARSGPRP